MLSLQKQFRKTLGISILKKSKFPQTWNRWTQQMHDKNDQFSCLNGLRDSLKRIKILEQRVATFVIQIILSQIFYFSWLVETREFCELFIMHLDKKWITSDIVFLPPHSRHRTRSELQFQQISSFLPTCVPPVRNDFSIKAGGDAKSLIRLRIPKDQNGFSVAFKRPKWITTRRNVSKPTLKPI